VRAHLRRELNGSDEDKLLLQLERVRMVDIGNAWALSTMATYQTYINRMLRFETRFGVPILTPESLVSPACSSSIALAWCQELYAWQAPSGNHPNSERLSHLQRSANSAVPLLISLNGTSRSHTLTMLFVNMVRVGL
jgi:hypothetical protein